MKEETEFKVLPWLRALRDRNAKEQAGLTVEERLRRNRRETEPLIREFRQNQAKADGVQDTAQAVVVKDHEECGAKPPPDAV